MTILVYDCVADLIYVDQCYTYPLEYGRPPFYQSKKRFLRDGSTIALSGDTFAAEVVVGALNALDVCGASLVGHRINLPGIASSISGFIRATDGTVLYVWLCDAWVDIVATSRSGSVIALGSGSAWFEAYHALGHTVFEAVNRVSEYHASCGGPIDAF